MRRFPGVITATLLLALAACGSNDDPPAVTAGEGAPADASAGNGAARRVDESVAAVLQSQGTPLATLRFTVTERPVAGQAFALQLSAAASQAIENLQLRVESTDLIATPEAAELMLDAAQTPTTRDFTLTAAEAGLAELTVRLSSEGSPPETVYVIPLLVAAAP